MPRSAICSNVTEQPSPFGDCAANPTEGSPSPSSAKWRTKLQSTPVRRGVERERRPDPRDSEPDRVAVDDDGVAVVGHVSRHDRDDHRLTIRRELEAELRPAAVARVQHRARRRRRSRCEVDRDARAEEIVTARVADECRRVQHRLRRPLRVDEPVGARTRGDAAATRRPERSSSPARPATAAASARRRCSHGRRGDTRRTYRAEDVESPAGAGLSDIRRRARASPRRRRTRCPARRCRRSAR